MRQFELILFFSALFAVLWPVVFGVRPRRGIVAGVLMTAFIAQLQLEGFRWQMFPLYLVAAGLAVGDILFVDRGLKWTNRVARGLAGGIGLVLVVVPAVLLPVPTLPIPSGPEVMSTASFEIVDMERDELYAVSPVEPRRFMAQVWYPAKPSEGLSPIPWSQDWDVVAPAVSSYGGLPDWFLNYTQYTSSSHFPSLPPAEGTYPVIIYSHDFAGFRTNVVNQIETLTSNGYFVISIDHTYSSVATRFDDGGVVGLNSEALPDEQEVGTEAYLEAGADLIDQFAGDIAAVLGGLEEGESGPFGSLALKADMTRVGVFGHGVGGGAAVRVCLEDPRCDAVLGMNPWVEPLPDRVIRIEATRPSLFMRSDEWRDTANDAVLRGIAGRGSEVTYWLGVAGAEHPDFTARPLLTPFGDQLGIKGPIPTSRIIPIVDNYLLGFFDVFLLGTGPASLDNVSFEEVSVEVIEP